MPKTSICAEQSSKQIDTKSNIYNDSGSIHLVYVERCLVYPWVWPFFSCLCFHSLHCHEIFKKKNHFARGQISAEKRHYKLFKYIWRYPLTMRSPKKLCVALKMSYIFATSQRFDAISNAGGQIMWFIWTNRTSHARFICIPIIQSVQKPKTIRKAKLSKKQLKPSNKKWNAFA